MDQQNLTYQDLKACRNSSTLIPMLKDMDTPSTLYHVRDNINEFSTSETNVIVSPLDIPIFTEEFLDHNKARESELRQLRKVNTDYEEQNAILSKHIENMKAAIEKLEVESVQRKATNKSLDEHLTKLRSLIVAQFSNFPIPGTTETVNPDNVEHYLQNLADKVTKDVKVNKECDVIVDKVRKIVTQMDAT
ncbi:high mobility group protein 20A [Tetranychus urticae]|uniref:Uncharacterized protein n=1 Tax=Tetranychus urticae TaxID=32264 RepID=T1L374_TETUR|nr:high mobility group protein 20A [Tetranychus urticae]